MRLPDGYALTSLDSVDSTNHEALRMARAGAGHGTVVVARTQTGGRGRRGRPWASPPGNLYMTIIVGALRHGATPGQLSFVTAAAVGEALAPYAPVRFKWPNDVLVEGRKVAGILIEAEPDTTVVGIGVNLVSAPADTAFPAACIDSAPAPGAILVELCHRFERWYRTWLADGFQPVRAAWLARADGIGGPIEARLPARTLAGTFAGLDADGALLLDRPDGSRAVVAAGDVFFGTG